jgi:serine/threonine protein kinase
MPGPAFQRIEELFHRAVALPEVDRAAFLDEACAGDMELRAAVEELLRHDPGENVAETFLASPLAREAERLRSDASTKIDLVQRRSSLPPVPGYEMLRELGRGGMGVVYKARQNSLNRIVALKMLLPDGSAVPETVARFRVEAEALARLQHPNIVPIYDVGEYDGRPYFTMEYVGGGSLAEWLHGRPQDSSAAAALLETLARTLHAVHQAGLIHRDLKPANILLQIADCRLQIAELKSETSSLQSAIPKLTDFGLVKDQTARQHLTQTGVAMGTPRYMAPEQLQHGRALVGPAADLYSLGAILYEMLTGRPPFDADSQAEVITQLLNEEPLSPARLRRGLPRDLVTICLKCLEKSPRRRYASAWELAEDLRRFRAGEPIRARPVGPIGWTYRWCRRRPLVASLLALTGLLLVALVATVVSFELRLQAALRATAEEERQQIVQLHVSIGLAELEEQESFAAFYHFVEALRRDQGGQEENHRTRIATTLRYSPELLRRRTIAGPLIGDPPLSIAVSPGGNILALLDGSGMVQVVDLGNETSHRLTPGRGPASRALAFRPDGRLLLTDYGAGTLHVCGT